MFDKLLVFHRKLSVVHLFLNVPAIKLPDTSEIFLLLEIDH